MTLSYSDIGIIKSEFVIFATEFGLTEFMVYNV